MPCGWLLLVILCVVSGGGKERRGHVMLPNKCGLLSSQINNKQINNSETHPDPTGMENTGINKLAGPSAKFHSTWSDLIPAGIGGALLRPP